MVARGELVGSKVIVRDDRDANRLYSSMYGKPSRRGLQLWPEEALFLCEIGRLEVRSGNARISSEELMAKFMEKDPRFPVRYAVYADLRRRGWKPKPGRKFGTEFRAFRSEDERIAVKVLQEEFDKFTAQDVLKWLKLVESTEFDLVVAIVDNDYDVNYYMFSELAP
ncbi:hypothetical protein [Methanopyrus sp. KOL6]|uniref:hypothetical protein n=1 Tax=Methanopyrus sp. KOL6 TaxID=1937004 RepID=UPI000B4ACD0A|nr:hypothetical protein [Methanopyrus sp. KOL6]